MACFVGADGLFARGSQVRGRPVERAAPSYELGQRSILAGNSFMLRDSHVAGWVEYVAHFGP